MAVIKYAARRYNECGYAICQNFGECYAGTTSGAGPGEGRDRLFTCFDLIMTVMCWPGKEGPLSSVKQASVLVYPSPIPDLPNEKQSTQFIPHDSKLNCQNSIEFYNRIMRVRKSPFSLLDSGRYGTYQDCIRQSWEVKVSSVSDILLLH